MRLPWLPGERNELVAHRRVERGMRTAEFRSMDGRESHVRADWRRFGIFARNYGCSLRYFCLGPLGVYFSSYWDPRSNPRLTDCDRGRLSRKERIARKGSLRGDLNFAVNSAP